MSERKTQSENLPEQLLQRLSQLPDQLVDKVQEAVIEPVMERVADALPDAVTKPLATLKGPLIARVTDEYRHKLTDHLHKLTAEDRYLRFGMNINDEGVRRYVDQLDLDYDDVFAVLDTDLQIAAMAHVAYGSKDKSLAHAAQAAEFGVSVDAAHRGKGYGNALLYRSIVHARAREVSRFFIHALSQNVAMISLARKAGMTIEMHGEDATGYITLPPADLSTLLDDALADGRASLELELRKRARWLQQQFGLGGAKEDAEKS